MTAVVGVFAFKPGDLVLVKWNDSMVYFAKIKRIDQRRKKCLVGFDDKSQDEADFEQIHSVDETTTDIICIKCKRDDSDSPNEIVLCDRCGIGYHQKCHLPPIPANALELDTPWNCAYCLKGVKCPYLTESLDVLQNLLSDEEAQSHDDLESVTTVESDEGGEEFVTTTAPQQHGRFLAPPRPHKKRGRKPKVKRGPRPKDPARSPVVQVKKEDSEERDSPQSESPGLGFSSVDQQQAESPKRKRPQFPVVTVRKRPRKSSVQSQTLSVTRIAGPVHGEGSSLKTNSVVVVVEEEVGKGPTKVPDSTMGPLQSPTSTIKTSSTPSDKRSGEKKPRSLRVSLTLPDEVEPGSPMEKVKKSQRHISPKFAISLPAWDDDLKLGSTDKTTMKSSPVPLTQEVKSMQSPVTSRSPTPKSEGLLTPFTASALPLQASSSQTKAGGDTRKRDREGAVEVSEPQKKIKLASTSPPPESVSDDVFSSPPNPSLESGGNDTEKTASPSESDPPPSSSVKSPQQTRETSVSLLSPPTVEYAPPCIASTLIPPTTTITPVGYGAVVEVDRPQAIDTPPVVTVPTDKVDVGVTSSPTLLPPPVKAAATKERTAAIESPSVIVKSSPGTPIPVSGTTTQPKNLSVVSSRAAAPGTLSLSTSSSSSATAVSVITASPSTTSRTPSSSSSSSAATPASSAPPTTNSGQTKATASAANSDIMITSVEPVTSEAVRSPSLSKPASSVEVPQPVSSETVSLSKLATIVTAPHTLYSCGKHRPGTRVTAKIAEVQPGTVTLTQKAVLHEKANQKPQASSAIVKSAVVKSPVVPIVATGYPQPSAAAATYTIVPVPDAGMSGGGGGGGGQGVAIAVPSKRSPKPSSLSIKNPTTAVPVHVVQQTPQSGHSPTLQYIIEPVAASTPVLKSHRAIERSSSGPPVYTQVVGSRTMPVTTTKPYAIVPAQPTSVEIQGIAVDQRGAPVINPQMQMAGEFGMVQGVPYVQTAITTTPEAKQATNIAGTSSRNFQGGARAKRNLDEQATAQLEEIGKKIGDAFANSSEQMLIAAFEDAWKKFQANGKRYQPSAVDGGGGGGSKRLGHIQETTHHKSCGPPNAEVVSVPGTSSRLSLIRPTYARSKISALQHSNSDQIVCVPTDPQTITVSAHHDHLQQKQVQYVYYPAEVSSQPQHYAVQGTEYPPGTTLYAIAPNNAQSSYDHVIKQGQRQGKSGPKTYQVHSSGVYIPARAASEVGSSKQAAIVLESVISGSPKPATRNQQQMALAQQQQKTNQEKVSASGVQHLSVLRKPQQQTIGGGDFNGPPIAVKTMRQCALCTREATYLCSGCHKIWYCGRDCQLKAWDEHSESCQA